MISRSLAVFPTFIHLLFNFSLSVRYSKSEVRQLILENEEYWFQPKGILFVNSTKGTLRFFFIFLFNLTNKQEIIIYSFSFSEPWCRFLSKTTNYHYYYHPKTKQSKFDKDRPPDANANTL